MSDKITVRAQGVRDVLEMRMEPEVVYLVQIGLVREDAVQRVRERMLRHVQHLRRRVRIIC